nr:hypothetical protein 11 [Spirochaetaceae bacterium]
MRSVSAAFWQAITQERTSAVFLMLVTIEHPDLTSPIRLVYNTQSVTSRGNTYQKYRFRIDLEDEKEDGMVSEARLTVEAIDQTLIQAIREIETAPTVTFELVLAADPDTVEVGPFVYDVTNVPYDLQFLSMTLEYQDVMDDEFPSKSFTPEYTPGLF